MIRIRDLILPLPHTESDLLYHAAQALRVKPSEIRSLTVFRRSLDARKKPELRRVYTVDVTLNSGEGKLLRQNRNKKITRETPYVYTIPKKQSTERPVIVGFGPAGMFAALVLAAAGLKPIVLERGEPAPERRKKVDAFWNGGALDPESNVQFGEGGAGTFSDGKLNTGTKNERGRWVLEQLVRFGAQEEILYDAKPHVGTDVLFSVVQNLREQVIALGGEVRFGARLTGLTTENGRITGAEYVRCGKPERVACKDLILAIGHSARDTFRYLHAIGVPMEPKPFSMGVRIEHKQETIDAAQYGRKSGGGIPPADYKLSCHLPDGSSAYTFCMCPGGYADRRRRDQRHERGGARRRKCERRAARDAEAGGLSEQGNARRHAMAGGAGAPRFRPRRRELSCAGADGRRFPCRKGVGGSQRRRADLSAGRDAVRS